LKKIKIKTRKPVAVGFGISSKEDIFAIKNLATIAIVGSALIRTFNAEGVPGVTKKMQELSQSA
jgi:tryptophan synthase alpha subunit